MMWHDNHALVNLKTKNVKSLQAFLGLDSYFRRLIPDLVAVAISL